MPPTTLTYIDSGVLIAAFRDVSGMQSRAQAILDDPQRRFASSVFVRLEVLPKAQFHRQTREIAFYEEFFADVSAWIENHHLPQLIPQAETLAARYGLNALDALHAAAARQLAAAEFITTEKPTTPLHRLQAFRIHSVYPPSA